MNKKLISLISALLAAASLAACGSSAPQPETTPPTTVPTTEAPTEATAPAILFEETVLVEDENCTFTITAIEEDSTWGYSLKAFLENKTNLELMFSLSNVSVNGFMCDPFWAKTVASGMKANETISFSDSDFKANGITDVTEIQFMLDIYDNSDWMADHLVSDTFTIYPMGEAAVQPYTREAVENEIVLFDDENSTMIVTGFDPDNTWGYTLNVYLENKTDKTLMFSIDGASVNGFMADPFWAKTVAPGKRSNTTISWSDSEFENSGITEVESISLPIRVYDANDWMAEDVLNDTFTVTP